MPPESHCPDRENLLALYRGELDAEAVEVVGQHLATCAICEAFLASVQEPEDGIVSNLRRFLNREHWIKREEFKAVEARAMAIPFEHIGFLPASSVPEDGAESTPQEQPPLTRLGKYELLKVLGRGGMGIVYAAVHTNLNRKVAVKVILPEYSRDARVRARFRREMQAIGELSHANIVAATDADEAEGCHFLVMELVDGLNLDVLLRGCGPLPVADACEIIRQAAVGLQYVHEHQRVHRDLKPSNLMLSSDGVVKILDLGLARLFSDDGPSEELTRSNLVMGTADYMAPEQWEDSHKVDIRADIYSLGCTLYKLLVGEAPFSDPAYKPPAQKKVAHARLPFPDVQSRRPAVPAGVAAVLERMMEKDPAGRFATPQEVAEALAPFTRGCECRQLAAAAMQPATADTRGQGAMKGLVSETLRHNRETPVSSGNMQDGGVARRLLHKRWRVVVGGGVGAVLLAAAGILGGRWIGTPQESMPSGVPVADTKLPLAKTAGKQEEPIQPGRWYYPLREWEPALVFPEHQRASRLFDLDRKREEIWAFSPGLCMVGLGKIDLPDYSLQLDIKQARWGKGVGIFFGCHPDAIGPDARPSKKLQVMEVRENIVQGKKAGFILARSWVKIERRQGELEITKTFGFAQAKLDPLIVGDENSLEIEVKQGRLNKAHWNKQRLVFVGEEKEGLVTEADFVGDFGTFNRDSSSVFGNARVMVFEREIK
jgi:eukaryotic-like serine/threonine-protein kinase